MLTGSGRFPKRFRNFSQTELNEGDPENPNWHADHIQWIEQTVQTIDIPLDTPEDES